jgi:COP9 signalosome complex subunit 3
VIAVTAGIKNALGTNKPVAGQLPPSILPEGEFWSYITNILLYFDPVQIRYVGHCLVEVVNIVASGAYQTGNCIPAIQLLGDVILRLDPTSSTFTSTHYTYVRLCLASDAFEEAVSVIGHPIHHIPGSTDKPTGSQYRCSRTLEDSSASYITVASGLTQKITPRMFLEYNMMCALCYIALGQYSEAIIHLEIVLVAPTPSGVVSALAIDAYRKWVLINLLVNGSVPRYPRPVYSATQRNVVALGKPYECLLEAFKDRDCTRLAAEIEEGQQTWLDDANAGLVMEVYVAHRKFSLLRMSKTFASVYVSQIEAYVPTPEGHPPTSVYLENLIAAGELRAELSDVSGHRVLRFKRDVLADRSETEVEQALNERARKLAEFVKSIGDVNHRLEVSREYVDMLKKLRKNREEDLKKPPALSNKSTIPSNLEDMDEDMMVEDF